MLQQAATQTTKGCYAIKGDAPRPRGPTGGAQHEASASLRLRRSRPDGTCCGQRRCCGRSNRCRARRRRAGALLCGRAPVERLASSAAAAYMASAFRLRVRRRAQARPAACDSQMSSRQYGSARTTTAHGDHTPWQAATCVGSGTAACAAPSARSSTHVGRLPTRRLFVRCMGLLKRRSAGRAAAVGRDWPGRPAVSRTLTWRDS